MMHEPLFLRDASVFIVLHAVTEAQHISGCGPCRAEVRSFHVDLFLQRLHHDASVGQVCVMSLCSRAGGHRLPPFHPRRDQQPTLRSMEVALFIVTALELATDVGHVVQEQPPVCEVHQSCSSHRSPHRQGWDPGLGDGHILLAKQFAEIADHFV